MVIPGAGELKGLKALKDVEKIAEATRFKKFAGVTADSSMLDELAAKGVRFSREDVIATARNSDGKVVFLETGNSKAGFRHVLNHADEFAAKGITEDDLPDFIMKALTEGKVVGYQGSGTGRPIYELTYKGKPQRVGVTVGGNGFIVGANPRSVG
ncbi:hypothetical protein [Streptomyces sp. HF10]|uniref:hypothetical protein n=1 Tax=Streptomyces sp. HF10 TaxID=2692233 RepID=UPI0013163F84|nr:hypothetical protein [Streptomyces sp. HF10]QHC31930.1 hypothetical protein GR129_27190 [Streptomyces sp. HF10]